MRNPRLRIAKEFKQFRLSLNLSQPGLALKCGKSIKSGKAEISKIENATKDVRASTLFYYVYIMNHTFIIAPQLSANTKVYPVLYELVKYYNLEQLFAVYCERRKKRRRK